MIESNNFNWLTFNDSHKPFKLPELQEVNHIGSFGLPYKAGHEYENCLNRLVKRINSPVSKAWYILSLAEWILKQFLTE